MMSPGNGPLLPSARFARSAPPAGRPIRAAEPGARALGSTDFLPIASWNEKGGRAAAAF